MNTEAQNIHGHICLEGRLWTGIYSCGGVVGSYVIFFAHLQNCAFSIFYNKNGILACNIFVYLFAKKVLHLSTIHKKNPQERWGWRNCFNCMKIPLMMYRNALWRGSCMQHWLYWYLVLPGCLLLFWNVLLCVLFWYYLPRIIISFFPIIFLVRVSSRHFSFASSTLDYPAAKHLSMFEKSFSYNCAWKIYIYTARRQAHDPGSASPSVHPSQSLVVGKSKNILSFQRQQHNRVKCQRKWLVQVLWSSAWQSW